MATETPTGQPSDPGASIKPITAPPRRRPPWKYALLTVLVGGLIVSGVLLYPHLDLGESGEGNGELIYQVSRNPLQVTVTAEGNVESASNIEVKCRVAGGSTILWIVEDGKIVDEGEDIVRLDTASIDDKLNSQRIAYEKALATQIQSEQDHEAAKIAVKEYEEGTFVEQLKQAEADIRIALENLRSAENQLKYSKRMARKGFVSSLQREADEFAVERANLDLDAANTRKRVLVEFTKQKMLKELEAKREAAAARLRSDQASLDLEKARLDRLQEQLKNCVITAPKKGMVVYANDARRSRFGGGQEAQVEEGAMVREGQALVRLPDLSQMQVKVPVHESRVDQLRPGLRARIVIQDQEYEGKVLRVANQPERTSWFSANVKEYATTVSIEGKSDGLLPGMTATVTILIESLTGALTVPVSAVVEQRGKFFCWVKTPQGPERRPLKLGLTNDKLIEVVDGVTMGEEVFRNPRAMVAEARRELPFERQFEDTKFVAADGAASEPSAKGMAAPPTDPSRRDRGRPREAPPGANVEDRPRRESRGEGPPGTSPPGESPRRRGRGFDLMQFDADGDGKLSLEEVPERMQGMFDRLDSSGDGFIDAAEIAEMRQRFRSGGGRDGSPRGGPGGEGPNRPPGGGDRGGSETRS